MLGTFAEGIYGRRANLWIVVLERLDNALHGNVNCLIESCWRKKTRYTPSLEELKKSLTLGEKFTKGGDRSMTNLQILVLKHLKNPWNCSTD